MRSPAQHPRGLYTTKMVLRENSCLWGLVYVLLTSWSTHSYLLAKMPFPGDALRVCTCSKVKEWKRKGARQFQTDYYQLFWGLREPQCKFPGASWGIFSSPYTHSRGWDQASGFRVHLLCPDHLGFLIPPWLPAELSKNSPPRQWPPRSGAKPTLVFSHFVGNCTETAGDRAFPGVSP